jgi:hypothetical protein
MEDTEIIILDTSDFAARAGNMYLHTERAGQRRDRENRKLRYTFHE